MKDEDQKLRSSSSLGRGPISILLEWFYLWTNQTHMQSSKGYDWANVEYVHAISKGGYRISGDPKLVKKAIDKKLQFNREGKVLLKLLGPKLDESFKDLLDKEPLLSEESNPYLGDKPIQIIHLKNKNTSNDVFEWITQNSDVDLFKTSWNGTSILLGSLYECKEKWHSQSVMPNHKSIHEYLNALAQKEVHFRFCENARSFERLEKMKYNQVWKIFLDENLPLSLCMVKELFLKHGDVIKFNSVTFLPELCQRLDCWYNDFGIPHYCNLSNEIWEALQVTFLIY